MTALGRRTPAARPCRRDPPARPRHGREGRRLRARPDAVGHGARHVLCRRPGRHRPQLRSAHRACRRHIELHPLCRLHHRLRRLDHHRHRPVLAGLDLAGRHRRRLHGGPGARRLCAAALSDRHPRRPAPGVAALRALRLRPALRLPRPADRHSGGGRGRRAAPVRHRALSGKPALSWRSGAGQPGGNE